MDKNLHTFIGLDKDYDECNVVLFGAPFDGTASYRPGARFGPSAVRNESFSIETYSPYQDKDLEDIAAFDGGDLDLCFGNTKRSLGDIYKFTDAVLMDKKKPFMIGGEHLVTLPAVEAVFAKYPNLHLIHFDAHADLRDSYLGERYSHSTVIRRCRELLGNGKIYQFGIRSGTRDEFLFAKNNTIMRRFDFKGIDSLHDIIKDNPVYLTIDLDVLDSSVFPGTGTPEAGGVSFQQLLEAAMTVSCLNIVALDVTELSPMCDLTGASTALACKLIRELLLAVG